MEEIVSSGEKLIKKIYPSRWYFWQNYLAIAILFIAVIFSLYLEIPKNIKFGNWIVYFLLIIGFIAIGLTELLRKTHTYYITDENVIEEFSFLSRRVVSVPYSKIQNIDLIQDVLERIVNIGNLEFYTAGVGDTEPEIAFRGIKNPFLIKNLIPKEKLNKM